MRQGSIGVSLAFCLALLATGPVFSQSNSNETAVTAAAAPVAYVYVQNTKGVYVYAASSTGKVAPVNGTPYPVVGAMEDVNGKYLISVGNTWLHAYPIESNGTIGKQAGTINTQSYGGSQCGETNGTGSKLDRTGKYLYVYLYLSGEGGNDGCAVMQSYQIESNGQFRYLGYVEADGNPQGLGAEPDSVPVFSSNDKFAYALYPNFEDGHYTSFTGFKVASNGDLVVFSGFEPGAPETPNDSWFYYPTVLAADNAGHLAVVLNWFVDGGAPRLASYTIDGNGNLTTTNTAENMPSLAESGNGMAISPSGKLLAMPEATGIHLFNFNGGAPITSNKRIAIPGGNTPGIAWDNNNHLYAIAGAGLYVYTATRTSVSEVAGSPFKIAAGATIIFPK